MENILPTDDVLIGRLIHKVRLKSKSRVEEIYIENSVIDFITFKNQIIIHEVKKSNKFEQAHVWQVKYYIYILRKYGLKSNYGIIHYPKQMKKVEVIFEKDDEILIEKAIDEIKKIISDKKPPDKLNKAFCKKCSYYDYCYI